MSADVVELSEADRVIAMLRARAIREEMLGRDGSWLNGLAQWIAGQPSREPLPEQAMSQPDQAPRPTGKAPEDVTLAGLLVPWNGDLPALLSMPGSDAKYLACFTELQALRKLMMRADCPYTSVKTIEDGPEFLGSLPEYVGGAPLHVILNPHFTPEGKVRFVQVARGDVPLGEEAGKAELLALARRMRAVSDETYWLFYNAGMGAEVHAFIEFCGVLAKYVDICERCAAQGIDFRFLNTHSGSDLPVEGHDMAYLGEKLDCILGPAIRANPAAREALRQALFDTESPAPSASAAPASPRTVYSPETTAAYGAVIDAWMTGSGETLSRLVQLMMRVHCDFTGELSLPPTHATAESAR